MPRESKRFPGRGPRNSATSSPLSSARVVYATRASVIVHYSWGTGLLRAWHDGPSAEARESLQTRRCAPHHELAEVIGEMTGQKVGNEVA